MAMTYQLTRVPGVVLRLSDNAFVTPDPESEDYLMYEDWIRAGHTPDPDPNTSVLIEPPSPEERLAAVGLTVSDLQLLLSASTNLE